VSAHGRSKALTPQRQRRGGFLLSPALGWALAALAFAAGWAGWGWKGLVLAATAVVFWLLLQFSRSLRVLRNAGSAPVGRVESAVVLHSRLQRGMTLMQVLPLTRSLGTKLGESPECWGWRDAGGAAVRLVFDGGKLQSWTLERGEPSAPGDAGSASPAS
jgi:hypothetical protein